MSTPALNLFSTAGKAKGGKTQKKVREKNVIHVKNSTPMVFSYGSNKTSKTSSSNNSSITISEKETEGWIDLI